MRQQRRPRRKQCSIAEARNHLPGLVHEAERGATVELTRRGKPVAVLVSLEDYERLTSGKPDLWTALEKFRERCDLDDADVDAAFAGVRDRSPGRTVKW